MPFHYISQLLDAYEAFSVLHGILNQRTPRELLAKYNDTPQHDEAEALLQRLMPVYDRVQAAYDLTQPGLADLFERKESYKANYTLAGAMIVPYLPDIGGTMAARFRMLSGDAQNRQAASVLLDALDGYTHETGDVSGDFAQFLLHLDELALPAEAKYNMVKRYHGYAQNLALLGTALDDVSAIIRPLLKPLQKSFAVEMAQLKAACCGDALTVSPVTGQQLRFPPGQNIDVIPVMLSTQIEFYGLPDPASSCGHLMWGLPMPRLAELREAVRTQSQPEAMRLIVEKTKFEILRAICEKPLYGGEIAARLGITSATVSHHIADLTSCGLISVAPEGARVYYSANKEKLAALIEAFKQNFV